MESTSFSGFHPNSIQFLHELQTHNDRNWFNKHKARYEADVLQPSLAFIAAMQKPLRQISSHYLAVPKRTGGSLMRIYRDTRFAHDKSPYKTNIGIHFRHERAPKDVHAPGYYLHISPDDCFVGCGIWQPATSSASKIRRLIDKDAAGWRRAVQAKPFRRQFAFIGESLKRPPKGYSADHPMIEDLKRKDFIVKCDLSYDELFDPKLPRTIASRMKLARPMMAFLCGALTLEF